MGQKDYLFWIKNHQKIKQMHDEYLSHLKEI
jgi:hypothetical protein